MSKNKITALTNLPQARLQSVILNSNRIETCEGFKGHPTLACLELRRNRLVTCDGLGNLGRLTEITLAENKIIDFSGLHNMPCLQKLDLQSNKIEDCTKLPHLPALEELDLSNNLIANGDCLPCFAKYPKLHTLVMTGCPFAEEMGDRLKNEVLVILGTQLDFRMVNDEEVG